VCAAWIHPVGRDVAYAAPDVEEEAQILVWVASRFQDLGFSAESALELAIEHCDWHEAQRLVEVGCPPELIAAILL
jgi:uncharacterized membrane-anchored protein